MNKQILKELEEKLNNIVIGCIPTDKGDGFHDGINQCKDIIYFIDQALTKVRENTKKECIDALPNKQREYSFDNQEFKECKGFNYCLSQVKELLTNLIK